MPKVTSAPVALVTGASRGVGRGAATALSQLGYSVYATGRSVQSADLPSSIHRLPSDHSDDTQTARVFDVVAANEEGLDVLVNCAWGGYERMVENGVFTWPAPFWEQPLHRWTAMFDSGVRAAFVCSANAARLMLPRRRGFIVNIGFWSAQRRLGNTIYGAAKAATDKMTADMAEELRPFGICAISLYPGLVRTEAVLSAAAGGSFDLSNSESPEFIGMVIAALHREPNLMDRSGRVVIAAAVGKDLGVLDVDGRCPQPLALADL